MWSYDCMFFHENILASWLVYEIFTQTMRVVKNMFSRSHLFLLYAFNCIFCEIPWPTCYEIGISPSLDIASDASSNEIDIIFRKFKLSIDYWLYRSWSHLLKQNSIVFILPRSLAVHKLISNDSNRPDVTFIRILIVLQRLGRHIVRWANIIAEFLIASVHIDSKSKISNFNTPFLNKNVGKFEVPVDYSKFLDLTVSIEKLLHHWLCLLLPIIFFLVYVSCFFFLRIFPISFPSQN